MISQVFIDRPRLAIVISVVTVLLGGLCLLKAPIAEYPEIAPPSLVVMANYTGAGAEEVADTVATVIEEQMNGLEDLLYFSSTSSDAGLYILSITFKSGTDTDIALVNVQNAVSRAEPLLPQIVKDNGVKYFKRSSDILALYNFATDGSELNQVQLSNYIRTNIRDPLARVDGVSEVSIMGERNYSMRIWVDPVKLSALNITPDDVANAVRSQNQQAAAGAVGTEPGFRAR
jgi:multidrug efflux pump subunit AcrB